MGITIGTIGVIKGDVRSLDCGSIGGLLFWASFMRYFGAPLRTNAEGCTMHASNWGPHELAQGRRKVPRSPRKGA